MEPAVEATMVEEPQAQEPTQEQPQKLSYDQLESIAHQLSSENKRMYEQLQKSQEQNFLARLNFLFEVLKNYKHFRPVFVTGCVKEIEQIMTIPEQTEPVTK